MSPLHVFTLGPIPVGEGVSTLTLGYWKGGMVAAHAQDLDEALHELRALAPVGVSLVCEPTIGIAGARHGFRSAPLPDDVLRARALLAFRLAHVDLAPPSDAPLDALLDAAAAWEAVRPWGRVVPRLTATVTGAVSGVFDIAREGDGVRAKPRKGGRVRDELALVFQDEPAFAVCAVAEGYGCARLPVLVRLRGDQPRAPETEDVRGMAAIVGAITLVAAGEPGPHEVDGVTVALVPRPGSTAGP